MEHYPNFLPKKYLSRNHYGRTHLEIDVERADKHDDRGNGLHEVGYGCLVGADLLRGLGKACRTLAGGHGLADRYREADECQHAFLCDLR